MRQGVAIISLVFVLCGIAAACLGIVVGCQAHERGIYGGFSFGDGQRAARDALIVKYGKTFVNHMRWANPPVHNIHGNSILSGTGQVREYHVLGQRGVKYCIQVWGPGENWSSGRQNATLGHGINVGGQYIIEKGCKF